MLNVRISSTTSNISRYIFFFLMKLHEMSFYSKICMFRETWDPGLLSLWRQCLGSLVVAQVNGLKATDSGVLVVCKCWGCSRVASNLVRRQRLRRFCRWRWPLVLGSGVLDRWLRIQRHRTAHQVHRRWRWRWKRLLIDSSLGPVLFAQDWILA